MWDMSVEGSPRGGSRRFACKELVGPLSVWYHQASSNKGWGIGDLGEQPVFMKEKTMAQRIERIEEEEAHSHYYYYDFHPTEEDFMSETSVHDYLIRYLMEVLASLFEDQRTTLYS